MTHQWDAATYDRVADPQTRWGADVVGRLQVPDGGRVLDAGCGTGRVTELVLERFPTCTVVGLDASAPMLEEARDRLARFGPRVDLVQAVLGAPLPLDEPVDAVVSTATFHWVPDHDALFAELARVMQPGGQLAFQCGGAGNIADVVAALEDIIGEVTVWNYATPEETTERLQRAGFVDVEAWLHPEPTPFPSRRELEEFMATAVLHPYIETRPGLAAEVADRLPAVRLDYVRLNVTARSRPAARPSDRAAAPPG